MRRVVLVLLIAFLTTGICSAALVLNQVSGPSLEPAPGSPVVVIAVKLVGRVSEDACLPSQGEGSALSRVLRLPVIGDPYAQFGEPDRGTLVDEYA